MAHLAADALVIAAAAGFGSAAVVWIAGTEYLDFYWIAIGLGVGLGVGLWLMRKKVPVEYGVARQIDARLNLADTLSTAAFFASPSAPVDVDAQVRSTQFKRAEELAQTVDLKAALPVRRPAALYPAAALALVALSVFLFRFAVTGSFDPRASLIKNTLESLFAPGEKAKTAAQQGKSGEQNDGETTPQEIAENNDFAGDMASEPTPSPSDAPAPDGAEPKDGEQMQKPGDEGAQDSKSDQGEQAASDDQQKQGDPKNGNPSGPQSQDPSMVDKLKQALSDLMNKMKQPSGDDKAKQQGKKGESTQAKGKEESRDDSKGDQSQDSSESQDGAEAKQEANNSSNQNSKQQQSGSGNNEGDKAQRQAAALKAMGKLSELMGKRAENVTGTVMMEVGATKQQMKTPTSQRAASHSEAGSEIHRDEIPVAYQQYVQQYFDQIRRAEAAANKPAAPKAEAADRP